MIEFVDVSKTYPNGTQALRLVSIKIPKGDFIYIIGQSGAGKSTFNKLITREEQVTKGKLFVMGKDIVKMKKREIPFHRRNIGVVFQDYRLFPNKTVYENVAFAQETIGKSFKEIKYNVTQSLKKVGLLHKASVYPSQLSGGEQQRVAIARAIVNQPSIIIADEPTGNLDEETAWEIMDLFNTINDEGTTIIMATHNKSIIEEMPRRVVVIERGEIIYDEWGGEKGYAI